MEITDYTTQEGRGSLQNLRRLTARAVSESIADTEKNAWLTALFTQYLVDVAANADGESLTIEQDDTSLNTRPDLISALRKAASESAIYAGDHKTQLIQDITDADTILTA